MRLKGVNDAEQSVRLRRLGDLDPLERGDQPDHARVAIELGLGGSGGRSVLRAAEEL